MGFVVVLSSALKILQNHAGEGSASEANGAYLFCGSGLRPAPKNALVPTLVFTKMSHFAPVNML